MPASDASSLVLFFLLPVLFIGYLFWSQRRRLRDLQTLQASVQIGDEIRTTSGLLGRVTALTDTEMSLEVAPGVVVRFDRRAVDTRLTAAPADGQ